MFGVRAAQGRADPTRRSGNRRCESSRRISASSLWRNQFDTECQPGKTISLNSHPYTVIGVAAEFKGTSPLDEKTDVWIPITMWRTEIRMVNIGVDWLNSRGSDFVRLYGRLKPGVTVDQASQSSDHCREPGRILSEDHAKPGARVFDSLGLSPADGPELQQVFGVQFGIVGIVLLIACANIAGFDGAADSRQKELVVRLALGAGGWDRLVNCSPKAFAGASRRRACTRSCSLVDRLASLDVPDENIDMRDQLGFALGWRILSFTLGLSVLTGSLFGLVPALQSSKMNLLPLLKDASARSGGSSRTRFGEAFWSSPK